MTVQVRVDELRGIAPTDRIERLKQATRSEERCLSVEQARLITDSYRNHPDLPRVLQRAHALDDALRGITIRVDRANCMSGTRSAKVSA